MVIVEPAARSKLVESDAVSVFKTFAYTTFCSRDLKMNCGFKTSSGFDPLTTPYAGRFDFSILVKLIAESKCPDSIEQEMETVGEG